MRRIFWSFIFSSVIANAKHGKGEKAEDDDEEAVATPSLSSTSTTSATPNTSATSTSLAPATSALPFQWVNPPNATTCQNATFSWHFTPLNTNVDQMTITVTNERVAQVPLQHPSSTAPTPLHADAPLTSRTLANDISPADGKYIWPVVDITQGWYMAIAFQSFTPLAGQKNSVNSPDMFVVHSAPFFIKNGTDVTCLAAVTSLPSAVTFSPTAPTAPTASLEPVVHAPALHGGLTTAQLAGTVVGVAVGLSVVAAGFMFPRLWRRALPSTKAKIPGRPYLLY